MPRPIRFGVSAAGFNSLDQLVERARWAEEVGFSTFSVSDHLNAPSPFVTLQAISDETARIHTNRDLVLKARADLLREINEATGFGRVDAASWASQLDTLSHTEKTIDDAARGQVR